MNIAILCNKIAFLSAYIREFNNPAGEGKFFVNTMLLIIKENRPKKV
jgi:hypothetical protein